MNVVEADRFDGFEFVADMDVAVMKKSSVRLFTIGGFLLLGSFALALAQHDSRNRSRVSDEPKSVAAQPAVPISVDDAATAWNPESAQDVLVRANNNELHTINDAEPAPAPESFENPLRGQGPTLETVPEYDVVTASGTEPVQQALPQLPAGPPSWLAEGQPVASPPVQAGALPSTTPPKLPDAGQAPNSNTPAANAFAQQANMQQPGLVALPTFPLTSADQSVVGQGNTSDAGANKSLNASTSSPSPSPFPTINALPTMAQPPAGNVTASMSDTQRQAMAPTNLQTPANQQLPAQSQPNLPASPINSVTGNGFGPSPNSAAFGSSGQSTGNAGAPSVSRASTDFQTVANPASRVPTALTGLVSNEPGNRYLDGSQNPIMLIQKRGPEEVRVGKKATFVITVRNAGNSAAQDVTVVDRVPSGMRFAEASPTAVPTPEGILTWKLGEMPPGDERTINLQMIPERQGELGSVASVHFAAQASIRTVATLPKLELQIDAQQESLIGGSQLISVTVKNTGTGVARGVRLEADLPAQLRHESGDQHLEAVFPRDLAPNQSERIELRSMAAQPGEAVCKVRALTEDGTQAEQQVSVMVLAPSLAATIEGPRLRYLDRQATYRFKVQNTGTASATNIDFVVRLPSGLRFNASDNQLADYNPADHTITIGLAELPVGQVAPFEITVLPVERGPQVLTLNATADLGVTTEAKGQVVVEGLAELAFTIGQDNGTIETGTTTTYSVQVTNIGNNPDKDVRLAVLLPNGAQVVRVDAPVRYRAEGNQIVFEPIVEMGNKDQKTFRFEVRHTQAGTQIVRTQLTSANWPVAVVKEEGTLVYNDQN